MLSDPSHDPGVRSYRPCTPSVRATTDLDVAEQVRLLVGKLDSSSGLILLQREITHPKNQALLIRSRMSVQLEELESPVAVLLAHCLPRQTRIRNDCSQARSIHSSSRSLRKKWSVQQPSDGRRAVY